MRWVHEEENSHNDLILRHDDCRDNGRGSINPTLDAETAHGNVTYHVFLTRCGIVAEQHYIDNRHGSHRNRNRSRTRSFRVLVLRIQDILHMWDTLHMQGIHRIHRM